MENLNEKIAILSTINKKNLDRLSELGALAFVDVVKNAIMNGEKQLDVDIGLGVVTVNMENEVMRFRFVPSAKLKEGIASLSEGGKTELENLLESTLKTKIENTYKDLF